MSDMSAADLVVDTAGAIGRIRLNRPGRGNSVTPEVITEMGDAVARLAEDADITAIVLTGTGKVFCAGADVQEMHHVYRTDGEDALMEYLGHIWMPAVQRTVRILWSCPKPIVAAINGAATAGGLDFALTCDQRVAIPSARFAESYVNLGMVPVAGGAFLVPRLVGPAAATRLMMTGELIDADEAARIGLVDHLCEADQLQDAAEQIAASLSGGPAATVTASKQIMRSVATSELEAILTASYEANVELLTRADVRARTVRVMERFGACGADRKGQRSR